jgi:hypothetical protein
MLLNALMLLLTCFLYHVEIFVGFLAAVFFSAIKELNLSILTVPWKVF